MNWLRLYIEIRNDAKLRALNDNEFRVWFNPLCLSSEQKERGCIQDIDIELLSLEVSMRDMNLLCETTDKLIKMRILSYVDNKITFINFLKHQYDKPSDHLGRTRAKTNRGVLKCRDNFTKRLRDDLTKDEIMRQINGCGKSDCPAPWDIFSEEVEPPKWGPGTSFATEKEYDDEVERQCMTS